MSGILFFIFASCEPLITTKKNYHASYKFTGEAVTGLSQFSPYAADSMYGLIEMEEKDKVLLIQLYIYILHLRSCLFLKVWSYQ